MNTPPFGRAPIAAGPAWNPDGSIKEVWSRWFTAIGQNVSQSIGPDDVAGLASMLGGARGATAESVMITALGLLTSIPPNPAALHGELQYLPPASPVPHPAQENPLAMLMVRPPFVGVAANRIVICTQPTFPTLANLIPQTFIYVTDYTHLIYWDGATPQFVGDNPGRIDGFMVNPGLGWALCDGSGANYLNANGTITAIVLPDFASGAGAAVYIKYGSPAPGVPAAAIAPTVAIAPFTPSGTNSVPVFTGIAMPLTTSSPAGAGTPVIATIDGSTVTITPRGAVSAPAFTGNLASPTAIAGTNGEPRNAFLKPYLRL